MRSAGTASASRRLVVAAAMLALGVAWLLLVPSHVDGFTCPAPPWFMAGTTRVITFGDGHGVLEALNQCSRTAQIRVDVAAVGGLLALLAAAGAFFVRPSRK